MKIAVPTRENKVDDHFGHCDHYTIFTVENKNVIDKETLPSPQGCGCKSNIAEVLQNMGVEVMIAGSMGDGAKNVLESHQIRVIRGCSGNVDSLVSSFLKGFVIDSGQGCQAHEEGHQCSNHAS